ncbi:tRNA(Glu) U13 pseudouridine synthase TruD [Methanonatronarchaeum thermophilum]|uniref:Probable tRNA pseudouridine synthase D n=1 Tax=Methanonatronarchaeum thermophilum TaxID=1927129 RepID=A0A1Y3GBP5_9EURY|nr:tRNA pseudouridine(13) synthase TruD [Methanonatronarchaeum thermophilum]OUJ18660.1 tRNA(Glu) U13 pseudouridine synthase TruD [Methanonatronarchaeum thermophilum]
MVKMRETENSVEKKVGIKYYSSMEDGVEGNLKKSAEDFIVREVISNQYEEYNEEKFSEYEHTAFKVKAKNWETNNLIREISDRLGVSKNRVGFAGTKDKKAITEQYMTIYNIKKKQLEKLKIKDVELTNYGLTNDRNSLGNLIGNKFEITIHDIINPQNISKITKKLNKNGIINYFGIQRFGTKRPNTHIVGKKIVQEKPEKAVKNYIAKSYPQEPEQTRKARKEIWDNWDNKPYLKGLKKLPNHLRYERAMLDHLHSHPNDYIGALRNLPQNLLQMFVHSYQSYLYHKMINERIKQKIPLNQCTEGDVVCYTDLETGILNRYATERVEPHNKQKIQEMIDVEKAFITAPLIGTQTKRAFGKMGEIEDKILNKEGTKPRDFKIKSMPELTSKGLRREITLKTQIKAQTKNNRLKLKFFLPKGCYATLITREYMKNGYN